MNFEIRIGRGQASAIAAAAVLSAALLAPPAGAQTKHELDKARVTFQEGVALMAANHCAAALSKFQAVIQVKRTPQVLFNIAECEERLGQLVSALGNFRLAAAAAEEGNTAKEVSAQVEQRIADLEARIPRLSIRRGPGAETATILLDGIDLGAAQISAEIPVDPGPHAVVAKVGDRDAWSETVALEEKGSKRIEVVIHAAPAERSIERPSPPKKPLEPAPASKVSGAVVLSAGVASGAAGVVFLALRGGAIGDLDEMCGGDRSCPPSAEATADQGKLYTGLAEVTIAAGAIGIAVGIVMLATSGRKGDEVGTGELTTLGPIAWVREGRGGATTSRGGFHPELRPEAPGANVGGLSVATRF